MDRQKLRRLADRLPFYGALAGLCTYVAFLVEERLLGAQRGGLGVVGVGLVVTGVGLVLALVTSWVLRRVSGMTWREALWPRRELPPTMASVNELARAGLRIQAIKMYRQLTGADLKAGVEAVDVMIAQQALYEPPTDTNPEA